MKKAILFIAASALLFVPLTLSAQVQKNKKTGTYKRIIFSEIGTPSLGISLNCDVRFQKGKNNGIGGQVGIGLCPTEDGLLTALPLGINYLLGQKRNLFEIGVILTPFLTRTERGASSECMRVIYGWGFSINPVFAWRYQPENEGLFFGAGISPLISSEQEIVPNLPVGGFVRMGYAF